MSFQASPVYHAGRGGGDRGLCIHHWLVMLRQWQRGQPGPVAIAEQRTPNICYNVFWRAISPAHPYEAHRHDAIHDKVGHVPEARESDAILRSRVVEVCADPRAAESFGPQFAGDVRERLVEERQRVFGIVLTSSGRRMRCRRNQMPQPRSAMETGKPTHQPTFLKPGCKIFGASPSYL